MEVVLEGMGGRRVGGPPKVIAGVKADSGGGNRASSSTAAAAAGGSGAAGIVTALAARLGIGASSSNSTTTDHPPAASATAAAATGSASEEAAAEQLPAAGGRADEEQLGYRHVPEWQFLWTKSVYGIKAAKYMQPGQVVSAVAGLNSLTMKKRMIATLKTVSCVLVWALRLVRSKLDSALPSHPKCYPQASPTALCQPPPANTTAAPPRFPSLTPPVSVSKSLGLDLAGQVAPISFCLPEEIPQLREWLQRHPEKDTGLWMLKTGQDAGKGLRLVPTCRCVILILILILCA